MKQKEAVERLLFVSEVRQPGDEAKARAVIERDLPRGALQRAGLLGFTAFFGSGYCVFEFIYERGFDRVFERLGAEPEVTMFLERLGRYVQPVPRIEPGETADEALLADVVSWYSDGTTVVREPARPRETRREIGRASD
jgi:hypothetical protein